jgi:acyl-CoA synthetase (AMP-forming)/AMP-acid ligase II
MAGMKFFGEEVEEVLAQHPAVHECRVFGRLHPQLGEIPVAEIVPADPALPRKSELLAHCRERLPAYKIPRELRFVAEPGTVTGSEAVGPACNVGGRAVHEDSPHRAG